MLKHVSEFSKKDFLDYGIRAALLVGALAGHFFLVQAKVDMLADKMEKMERVYEKVVDKIHDDAVVTEGVRSKYTLQVDGNTRRLETLEQQVQELRETNREILTILKGMRKEL
jgi:phosphatidylserine decarboxylase